MANPIRISRLIPAGTQPGQNGGARAVVNGRTYAANAGTTLDVPEPDAFACEGQGFIRLAWVGPTSARPVATDLEFDGTPAAMRGVRFIDTTLAAEIVADANGVWRSAVTGAAV